MISERIRDREGDREGYEKGDMGRREHLICCRGWGGA